MCIRLKDRNVGNNTMPAWAASAQLSWASCCSRIGLNHQPLLANGRCLSLAERMAVWVDQDKLIPTSGRRAWPCHLCCACFRAHWTSDSTNGFQECQWGVGEKTEGKNRGAGIQVSGRWSWAALWRQVGRDLGKSEQSFLEGRRGMCVPPGMKSGGAHMEGSQGHCQEKGAWNKV